MCSCYSNIRTNVWEMILCIWLIQIEHNTTLHRSAHASKGMTINSELYESYSFVSLLISSYSWYCVFIWCDCSSLCRGWGRNSPTTISFRSTSESYSESIVQGNRHSKRRHAMGYRVPTKKKDENTRSYIDKLKDNQSFNHQFFERRTSFIASLMIHS